MGEGDKPKRRPVLLVILVIIVLVALWILVPNISKLTESDNEKTKSELEPKYNEFEGQNIVIYKNQSLNVTLIKNFNLRRNTTNFEAHWVNIMGRPSSVSGGTPEDLYDEILREGLYLTVDQIEWFEYIIEEVIR